MSNFDQVVLSVVERLIPLGDTLGGDLVQLTKLLVESFRAQSAFLTAFLKSPCNTNDPRYTILLEPLVQAIGSVSSFQESLARSPFSVHAQAATEGIGALSWITVQPSPVAFITETIGTMMFYGNKIMIAHKGKEPEHIQWVKTFEEGLKALAQYVKATYPTGLCSVTKELPQAATPAAPTIISNQQPVAQSKPSATIDDVQNRAEDLVTKGTAINETVATLSNIFLKSVSEMLAIVKLAPTKRRPTTDEERSQTFRTLLERFEEVQTFCEKGASGPQKLFCLAIRDIVSALAWVANECTPASFIKENEENADFHTNKILREKIEPQVTWVKTLKAFCSTLIQFAKENHSQGLQWSSSSEISSKPEVVSQTALFGEIREGVTQGLRKVTDDQKLYKQKDRSIGTVNAEELARRKKGKGWAPPTGTPCLELIGDKKWMVEYQSRELDLDSAQVQLTGECEKRHTVFISRCQNVTITVPSKVNTISINECLRVTIRLHSTIGPVEITNSQYTEIIILDRTPSVVIDKCEETNLQVPQTCVEDIEIVTSLSTNTNVVVPKLLKKQSHEIADDDDMQETKELPIPEQFVSKIIKCNKVSTKSTEHSCG